MNKLIAFLLLFLFTQFMGCNTHKKIIASKTAYAIDSTSTSKKDLTVSSIDSMTNYFVIKSLEKNVRSNVKIIKGEKEVVIDPYTVTASFKIDTTASGDTVRLISQENDNIKFQIFYDKKQGNVMAQIEGKGRKIKTAFDQINISNSDSHKESDSIGFNKSVSSQEKKNIDSGSVSVNKRTETSNKNINIRRTQVGTIAISIVVLAALIFGFIIYKKPINIFNSKKTNNAKT